MSAHWTYHTHCHLCRTRYSFSPESSEAFEGSVPCPRTQHRNNVPILRGEKHDISLKIMRQAGFETVRQAATLKKLRLRHNPMAEGGPVCIFRSTKFPLKFVQGTTPEVKKTWVDMLDNGSNSGKRFSKWPPEVILKNLYVNMFWTSWPILMIKMSSRGVFRVLNRLERVLIWPEVRIMRNSKWPPFSLEQIIFLFMLIYNWHR